MTPPAVAHAAGAMPSAGRAVAEDVVRLQAGFDPYAPWALAALLLLAGWALARRWQRAQRPFDGAGGRGFGAPLDPAPGLDGMVAAGLMVLVASLWGGLAWAVNSGPYSAAAALDLLGLRWAAAHPPALTWLALRLGEVGDVTALGLLTAAVALWLLGRRQRFLAGAWVLAIVANSLAVRVLKNAFERARPAHAPDLITSGFSFPSGHAAGAMMVFGLLAWVLCDQVVQRGKPWVVLAFGLLIAAISASRVVLQVHYPTDVLGGLLWSAMALLLTIGVMARARRW